MKIGDRVTISHPYPNLFNGMEGVIQHIDSDMNGSFEHDDIAVKIGELTPFVIVSRKFLRYTKTRGLNFGFLMNRNSFWVGIHYSKHNRRYCINIVPCLTLWVTLRGGKTPDGRC